MDEGTDVAGLAVPLVLMRYVFESNVKEELLLCKPLPCETTGEAIFTLMEDYFKTHDLEQLH